MGVGDDRRISITKRARRAVRPAHNLTVHITLSKDIMFVTDALQGDGYGGFMVSVDSLASAQLVPFDYSPILRLPR